MAFKNGLAHLVGSARLSPEARRALGQALAGKVSLTVARYGGRGEGALVKARCADAKKLAGWLKERGVDVPVLEGDALPRAILTGKAALALLGPEGPEAGRRSGGESSGGRGPVRQLSREGPSGRKKQTEGGKAEEGA